ncbi:hypothetical protein [Psychroflexus montanilacus]|uniref:hypothetical protein n=1 Tax=Psychroflexus montanilacus TaxID=2873598 RepID=UPI001CCFA9E1|nr:hypothetical protein [Psychroflexus montanilacus]MBZ9650962.1 hypothetical protein [Psychroflexus montanilacus]
MKFRLLSLLLFSFLFTKAQTSFKPGYFISNGKKTECLIKDEDWRINPVQFEYKLMDTSKVEVRKLYNTSSFGIYKKNKFIKETVEIDQSTDIDFRVNYNKEPEFEKKKVFLRILVEGNATLFKYSDNSLTRFFYQVNTKKIQPLVYKKYRVTTKPNATNDGYTKVKMAENNTYKQELFNNVFCDDLEIDDVEKLQYKAKDLIIYFKTFNSCNGNQIQYFETKEKRKSFSFYLKGALDRNDVRVTNTVNGGRDIDFGKSFNFRYGVEAEFILPFKNDSWSVFVEPTYHSYSNEASRFSSIQVGETLNAEIQYKSLQVPLGVRRYIYLSKQTRLFFNTAIVMDFSKSNNVSFTRRDGSAAGEIKNIDIPVNFFLGAGVLAFNRLSLETRIYTRRGILGNFVYYSNASAVLGFKIF